MTACDAFTRFVIAVPLPNTTALSVACALVHEVVLKYGMPQSILTDLSGEFQNELWKELCQLLGFTRVRITAYWQGHTFHLKFWVKLTALERNRRFSIYFRPQRLSRNTYRKSSINTLSTMRYLSAQLKNLLSVSEYRRPPY